METRKTEERQRESYLYDAATAVAAAAAVNSFARGIPFLSNRAAMRPLADPFDIPRERRDTRRRQRDFAV